MHHIGVIGLGMIGLTHLDVYAKRRDVKVVAVSDANPDRLSGRTHAVGNVKGQAQGIFDLASARRYAEGLDLIADPEVQVVDVCLPTPQHLPYASAAIQAGKHVIVEKPLARTAADAMRLAKLAARSKGQTFCALCMRFWPGWSWLKDAVANQTYGPVRSATFARLTSHPGGRFYLDGDACGGAILDLHLHDTDFIHYVFGMPAGVISRGYSKQTSAIDHVVTQYLYDDVPLVTAEGGWTMAKGFGFAMRYTVNFDGGVTAMYDLAQHDHPLKLIRDGNVEDVAIPAGLGYEIELAHFLECIAQDRPSEIVSLESAARSVKIVEAEAKSAMTGKVMRLRG